MNNLEFPNIIDPDITILKIHSVITESPWKGWKTEYFPPTDVMFFNHQGESNIFVDNKMKHIKENSVIYVPANSRYLAEEITYPLTFTGIYFSRLNNGEENFISTVRHFPGCKSLKNKFLEAEKLFTKISPGRNFRLKKAIYSILDGILSTTQPYNINSSYYTTIKPAIDYIEENYMTGDMSSVFLANLCNITPIHFARCFRSIYGTNPKDYIIRLKMTRAEEYLMYSAYSVLEISNMLGYSEPSYFSSAFKHIYGISPSEYRKRNI